MKIGIVVNNLDTTGGYQKLVLRMYQELIKMGHEAIIYTLSLNKERCYPDIIKEAKIIALLEGEVKNSSKVVHIVRTIFYNISNISKMRSLARLIASDLDGLILHDEPSLHLLPYYKSSNRSFKVAWMLNNQLSNDFLDTRAWSTEHFAGSTSLRTIVAKLVTLVPEFINHKIVRKRTDYVDRFAVYDSFNRNLVEQRIKRNADLIYAGADLQWFEALSQERVYARKDVYNILSVGVIFPHRRYEDLLYAVSYLVERGVSVQLNIVGAQDKSPSYFKTLVNIKERLKIEKYVRFINYVSDDELKALYKSADVFAFVNNGFTWGISVFEAVAAGLPVVITNNIGAADIIENAVDGWVVNPCQPKEISDVIEQILSNPEKNMTICRSAQTKINDLLTWRAYTQRIMSLIEA